MLAKKQRLTGKDINYMLKKWKRVYGKVLIFRVIPQYANNKYNQRWFQIPIKVDKRAVMRNALKRKGYEMVNDFWFDKNKYYKIFVSTNKKHINPLVEHIATHKKTAILQYREALCAKDFSILAKELWWIKNHTKSIHW